MSKINDGGPAFPISVQPDFQYTEAGMSLRDWFAAHAPDEVPDWYEPDGKPEHPKMPKELVLLVQNSRSDALTADEDQRRVELGRQHEEEILQYYRELKAWEIRRHFAWRWHYADAMLAARERQP